MGTVPWASSPLLPLWEGWFLWAHAAEEEEESGAKAAR